MAKYLMQATFSVEGMERLKQDGGSKRRAANERLVAEMGGRIEAFFYGFGDTNVYAIVDFPENVGAATEWLTIGAGGVARATMTALLTAEELDAAGENSREFLSRRGLGPAGQPTGSAQ
jgi:uncharacterized protein with GYD domain